MVIIVSKQGHLANRIWHASSFLANAQEHHYRLYHFFFDDYYSFYSESLNRNNTPIRFLGKRKTWLISFLKKSTTILVKVYGYQQGATPFDLNDEKFLTKAKSKLVLVYGWRFCDPVNRKKYRELLLDTWTPNKNFRERIEAYYNQYKKDHDILVGVHIRKGDYKKFEGGKWYYTSDQYYRKIKEVAALEIFNGKRLAFVICTNEKNVSLPGTKDFSVFNEERHL
jgi:hypothetical protein